MSDRVTVEISDGVADVRLNRPEKLNALDTAMFQALADTSRSLASEPLVRAVVLSGEGRGFCSGLDFSGFMAMAGDGGGDAGQDAGAIGRIDDGEIGHLGQRAVYGWTELAVPVIAAVHGVAFGGGFQVCLGADLRIVAPDARLSVMEIKWGLTPDMCVSWLLPRLVGLDVAKELTWTGREVSGEEAVALGVATRVAADPRAEALALATEIAAKSPDAIRRGKALLEQAGTVGVAEQFATERESIGSLIATPNQIEAVTANFEKRQPAFTDPT